MRRLRLSPATVVAAVTILGGTPMARANSWFSAPHMPTPRYALGAVYSGADDRIYAVGGVGPSVLFPTIVNAVEAYNPINSEWTTTAPMPTARAGLAVAVGGSSRDILAIGGEDDTGVLSTVESFNPIQGSWITLDRGRALTARAALAAASPTDTITFAIGGSNGGAVLSTVEVYDFNQPDLGWVEVTGGRPLTAREKLAATVADCPDFLNVCIYAIGGLDGSGVLSTVEVYNPNNPSAGWVPLTAGRPLTPRQYLAATTQDCPPPLDTSHRCIYAIGGAGAAADQYLDIVEAYDLFQPQDGWRQVDSLPRARSALAAVAGGGLIYAIGGASYGPVFPAPHDTVEQYGPDPNSWTLETPMPFSRYWLAAVTDHNGRIFAIGGRNEFGEYLRSVKSYDPVLHPRDGWIDAPDMILSRSFLAAAEGTGGDHSLIYAIGGGDPASHQEVETYRLDPPDTQWVPSDPLPAPRAGLAATVGPCPYPTYQDTCIYAIGGCEDFLPCTPLNTVFVRDLSVGESWRLLEQHLQLPRAGLASVTSLDGERIYAIGGATSGTSFTNTVEVFNITNPEAGWAHAPPMSVARQGLGAATAANDHIFVFGGCNATECTEVAEEYNPGTESWSLVQNMPMRSGNMAVTASPDRRTIYVLGGRDAPSAGPGGGVLDTVQAYHPETRGWTNPPSMSTKRFGHADVTAPCPTPTTGTCVYALGGRLDLLDTTVLNSVEAYRPGTEGARWTLTAPMPTARTRLAAATGPCPAPGTGQCIYAAGGNVTPSIETRMVEVYDPSTDSWATAAPLPTGRFGSAAATGGPCPGPSEGQCIYVLGGLNFDLGGYLTTVEVYDPSTGNWTAVAPMSTARGNLAAVAGPDSRIYAVGGVTNGPPFSLNTVEAFDPRTGTWSPVALMNDNKPDAVAAIGAGGHIYAMSGSNLEVYIPGPPEMDRWVRLPTMTQRGGYAATRGPDGRIYRVGGYFGSDVLNTVEALQP